MMIHYINGAQDDKTSGVVPASKRLLANPIFEDLQRDLDSVDEAIPSLQPRIAMGKWHSNGTHSRIRIRINTKMYRSDQLCSHRISHEG